MGPLFPPPNDDINGGICFDNGIGNGGRSEIDCGNGGGGTDIVRGSGGGGLVVGYLLFEEKDW